MIRAAISSIWRRRLFSPTMEATVAERSTVAVTENRHSSTTPSVWGTWRTMAAIMGWIISMMMRQAKPHISEKMGQI